MKRIRPTYNTLHVLKATDPKLSRTIIANSNQEAFKSICECAFNVLRGNITLSACSKRKLITYKNSIRKVADKNISISAKRNVIDQQGADFFCRCCLLYYRLSPDFYSARVNYVR